MSDFNPISKAFEVDGIHLDPDNQEFIYALEFALQSNRNLYLTGKAGSGKTTFLKYLRTVTTKEMAVVAPTGVAAVNAGGQTIHSFFKIKPSLYVPGDKRLRTRAPADDPDKSTIYDIFRYDSDRLKIIKSLELLVIDEVSMVRADLLDVIDTLLRVFRQNQLPFGGVQVILIGDTFQLPPVVNAEERQLLYQFYDSEFFFSAKVIQRDKPIYIELKKIYRQNEQDFINLLNRVRVNRLIDDDYRTLYRKFNPDFRPKEGDNYIILATKNDEVREVNDNKLELLGTPLYEYEASIDGEFPENNRPTDTLLKLKVGAQVMFIKNDREKRFFNGKIGVVKETGDSGVKVVIEDGAATHTIDVQPETWKNIVYSWDEDDKRIKETEIGSFTQFPLRLAWAITVHKSQGLTFEKVIADLGDSFASGQVYVALSRCTSLNGLVLSSPIVRGTIKTDWRVLDFARNETPETLLTEQLSSSKADYYYGEARKAFHSHNVGEMIENLYSAIKYRNDINTDTFRRYVSVWSERLFRNTSSIKQLDEDLKGKQHSLDEASARIESLEERIGKLEEELSENRDVISELKKERSRLEEQNGELKAELEESKSKVTELQNTVSDKDVKITALDSALTNHKECISDYFKKISELSTEVHRLRDLKWYEKLFGKK